ncbi:hypothetical protein [Aeromonas phage phiA014S]|uniref:Uncharacterized protein n=1 Tax=Aeromonas phage phiA014S TaxID=3119845 RepID=A0ABZ2CLX0_9CAUD
MKTKMRAVFRNLYPAGLTPVDYIVSTILYMGLVSFFAGALV